MAIKNSDVEEIVVTKKEHGNKGKPGHGKNSPMIGENGLITDPGDTTKIVQTNMKFMMLPKIDLHDPEEVKNRIVEYFKIYAEEDMKPTIAGLALALDIDRRRLWEIRTGNYHTSKSLESLPTLTTDYIKKAHQILEATMESYSNSGKINPVMAIFMMKNHFGYVDKQEHVLTPNTQQDDDYSADDIKQRYLLDSE
jgi:hypothetical protein